MRLLVNITTILDFLLELKITIVRFTSLEKMVFVKGAHSAEVVLIAFSEKFRLISYERPISDYFLEM